MEGGQEDMFLWAKGEKGGPHCPAPVSDFKFFFLTHLITTDVDVVTAERYFWHPTFFLPFELRDAKRTILQQAMTVCK